MIRTTRGLAVLITTVALAGGGLAAAGAASATPAPTGAAPALTATSASAAYTCSQGLAPGLHSCLAMRRTDVGFHAKSNYVANAANPALTPSGFGPSSLQSAYLLPSATAGSGQRVYVVDAYDDPNAESDLSVYRSQYGLSPCTTANGCFKKLNQNGLTSPMPSANTGWAGEISLDLAMVSAICPNCGITLIESNDNGNSLYAAVKEAATLGAKFVSLSWGGSESSSEASIDATYFKSTGVVYTVSTGDSAYSGGVEYPAASPLVVAVGGTSLTSAANARGWNETVWKNSSSQGTGSGCSAYGAKPAWQSVIATATCSRRALSDVSAVADPYTGVAVYQTYGGSGWTVYGGTSAAAPIIASVYALAGTPAATDKPSSWPYANTGSLFDVTSGNNGTCSPALLCTAASGWDGPTGLGTPNGVGAFRASGGGGPAPNTVTVTNPGARSGTVGTATSLQISANDSGGATLTYAATGLPPGLSIASGTGLISGTPTSTGTYTVTVTATDSTNASGSATFSWTIAAAGQTCSGQLLKNPGLESGSTSWSATAGVISSGSSAHTGTHYAWLDGYGRNHVDTLSQAVTIPTGCHATLSYYLSITSSDATGIAHDTLVLTAGSTTLQSFTNVNRGSGYVLRTVDLSAFGGQTVTLKWTGTEDNSSGTSFLVDDTAVTIS